MIDDNNPTFRFKDNEVDSCFHQVFEYTHFVNTHNRVSDLQRIADLLDEQGHGDIAQEVLGILDEFLESELSYQPRRRLAPVMAPIKDLNEE